MRGSLVHCRRPKFLASAGPICNSQSHDQPRNPEEEHWREGKIRVKERMKIMRRIWTGALALTLAAGFAVATKAQELTQADKDKALQYLESTKKGVEDATKGLSTAQWNFKSAPERWSIAQVMEHIAAAEDMLRGVTVEKVMLAPAAPDRDVKHIDEMVVTMVTDRSHKADAPEPLRPVNRFGSPAEALKHFVDSRMQTEDFLKRTPDLRAHAVDSPLGQKLDGYEWVLFIAAHSERHTKQINEVKADPNFPKQ
jgi:DinB family protein